MVIQKTSTGYPIFKEGQVDYSKFKTGLSDQEFRQSYKTQFNKEPQWGHAKEYKEFVPKTPTTPKAPSDNFVGDFKDFKTQLGLKDDTFNYASEKTRAEDAEQARLAAIRQAITGQATRERETAQDIARKREGGREALLGVSQGLSGSSYGLDYLEQVDTELQDELRNINTLETEALSKAKYTSADELSRKLTEIRTQRDEVNQKIIDNFNTYQDYKSGQEPTDYNDYEFYIREQEKTGKTPLSYFEWKAKLETSDKTTEEVGGVLYERQDDGSWKAVTEAQAKEPTTKVITAGGRSLLINTQTGETIKDLGGAYKGGTGTTTDKDVKSWDYAKELLNLNPNASDEELIIDLREKTKLTDSDINTLIENRGIYEPESEYDLDELAKTLYEDYSRRDALAELETYDISEKEKDEVIEKMKEKRTGLQKILPFGK